MLKTQFTPSETAMDVRVEFYPEHAADFVYENEDGSSPLFATFESEDVNEVAMFVKDFDTAIKDVNIYFRENGKVVNLQDFTFEI